MYVWNIKVCITLLLAFLVTNILMDKYINVTNDVNVNIYIHQFTVFRLSTPQNTFNLFFIKIIMKTCKFFNHAKELIEY